MLFCSDLRIGGGDARKGQYEFLLSQGYGYYKIRLLRVYNVNEIGLIDIVVSRGIESEESRSDDVDLSETLSGVGNIYGFLVDTLMVGSC